MHDPGYGGGDDRCGVVRVDHLDAWREERLEFVDGLAHALYGVQRVGAGRQLQRQTGGRLAVEMRADGIVFTTQLDLGDVAQAHLRAIAVDLEQDVAELLRGLQTSLADNRGIELLARQRRQATQLSGRDLDVLRLDRRADIHRRKAEVIQLGRVEPDAHCVLGTEHLEVPHALGPRDRVLHVGDDVVRQVTLIEAAIGGDQTDDDEKVAHRLCDADALLLNLLRQQRRGQLQLVLHLHLGDIGIGALVEGDSDFHTAVGVARRGDVAQPVDAVELLFDDLDHGVLHRLRRGARIGHGNADRRRSDARILVDRQS